MDASNNNHRDLPTTAASATVGELTTAIPPYINGWNNRAHPFNWTKTADQILTKANRQKISNAEH